MFPYSVCISKWIGSKIWSFPFMCLLHLQKQPCVKDSGNSEIAFNLWACGMYSWPSGKYSEFTDLENDQWSNRSAVVAATYVKVTTHLCENHLPWIPSILTGLQYSKLAINMQHLRHNASSFIDNLRSSWINHPSCASKPFETPCLPKP